MNFKIWIAIPIVVVVATVVIWQLGRRGYPAPRLLAVALFFVYVTGVAAVTIFPIRIDPEYIEAMRREATFASMVNLVPFRGMLDGNLATRQAIANTMLGVPLGFLLPFLMLRADRVVLGVGVVLVMAIEAVQLVINLLYGFAYRIVDINDVILNSLGVAIGLLAFRLLSAAYRASDSANWNDEHSYLHRVMTA